MDPITLAIATSAASIVGHEYAKGFATEAGKASWAGIKALFNWKEDPKPADVPKIVATELTARPELLEELIQLLKSDSAGTAASVVNNVVVQSGGKAIFATKIDTVNM